eukprot:32767-Eustigmatos_ZCMA.PRE.1
MQASPTALESSSRRAMTTRMSRRQTTVGCPCWTWCCVSETQWLGIDRIWSVMEITIPPSSSWDQPSSLSCK